MPVKFFDKYYDTARQALYFVLFYDGSEKKQQAVAADLASFRKSWQRPKWHILKEYPPELKPKLRQKTSLPRLIP